MLRRIENTGDAWAIQRMQRDRIKEYPFTAGGNYVIDNDFEGKGTLRIYENIGDSFVIQDARDHLCAEAILNDSWGNCGTDLFLHKISCCYGFESLAPCMMEQALGFARFYQYERIGMPRTVYHEWAGEMTILSGFQQDKHGVYVLELPNIGGSTYER